MWLASFQLTRPTSDRALFLGQREDAVAVGGGAGEMLLLALLRHLPVKCPAGLDRQGDRRALGRAGPSRSRRSSHPAGGVVSSRRRRRRRGSVRGCVSLGGSSCWSSLAVSVSLGLSAATCLSIRTAASVKPFGQVVVGEHEPGTGRLRSGLLQYSSRARSWVV